MFTYRDRRGRSGGLGTQAHLQGVPCSVRRHDPQVHAFRKCARDSSPDANYLSWPLERREEWTRSQARLEHPLYRAHRHPSGARPSALRRVSSQTRLR